MKTAVYLLGLLVLGYIVYYFVKDKKSDETIVTNPITNSYLQTQPSQLFPLQIVETPRVDDADQPWYGGDRNFLGATSIIDTMSAFDGDTSPDYQYNSSEMWSVLASQYSH